MGVLDPNDMEQIFNGKIKGKGSGKGLGRRSGNPKGKDGEQLKCHNCGSTDRLVARCDQRHHGFTGFAQTSQPTFAASRYDVPEPAPASAFSDGLLVGFETDASYYASSLNDTNPSSPGSIFHTYNVFRHGSICRKCSLDSTGF